MCISNGSHKETANGVGHLMFQSPSFLNEAIEGQCTGCQSAGNIPVCQKRGLPLKGSKLQVTVRQHLCALEEVVYNLGVAGVWCSCVCIYIYIYLFMIAQPLFGLSVSGRGLGRCREMRDAVLRYSQHVAITCLQSLWYSWDWNQNSSKLLVFAS